jgi:hypothetical protein
MASLPGVAQAADIDTLVNFTGDSGATARFYFPVGQDMRLVTGVMVNNPIGTDGTEMGYAMRAGVELNLPIVGVSEITAGFEKSTVEDSDTNPSPIKLTKNAVFNISKDVKVGLSVDLITIGVDGDTAGGKHVGILESINPVVGATIRF